MKTKQFVYMVGAICCACLTACHRRAPATSAISASTNETSTARPSSGANTQTGVVPSGTIQGASVSVSDFDLRVSEIMTNPPQDPNDARFRRILEDLNRSVFTNGFLDPKYGAFIFWIIEKNVGGDAEGARDFLLALKNPTPEDKSRLSSNISNGNYSLLEIAMKWQMADFVPLVQESLGNGTIKGDTSIAAYAVVPELNSEEKAAHDAMNTAIAEFRKTGETNGLVKASQLLAGLIPPGGRGISREDMARTYLARNGDATTLKQLQDAFEKAPEDKPGSWYPHVKDKWYYYILLTVAGHRPDTVPAPMKPLS